MTYLPSDYISSNFSYSVNNNYYVVRTNRNCQTQYNNTYCDCYNIYFNNDYLVSSVYSCSLSSNSGSLIPYTSFTDNFYYRLDFANICIIFLTISLLCYFFAFKPISRLFGRWLKL